MASKRQFTGMTGLYLVAAELSKQNLIVSPTSRSALAADLLVTDALCKNMYAVQVKTNAATFNFWLVNKQTPQLISDSLVYALVNLRKDGPEFFLVPSSVVAANVAVSQPTDTSKATWYSIDRTAVLRFKDNWEIFKAAGVPPVESPLEEDACIPQLRGFRRRRTDSALVVTTARTRPDLPCPQALIPWRGFPGRL